MPDYNRQGMSPVYNPADFLLFDVELWGPILSDYFVVAGEKSTHYRGDRLGGDLPHWKQNRGVLHGGSGTQVREHLTHLLREYRMARAIQYLS